MSIRSFLSRGRIMGLGRQRSRNIQLGRSVQYHSGKPFRAPTKRELDQMIARATSYAQAKKIAEANTAPEGYVYCEACFKLVKVRADGKMTVHSVPGTPPKPWNRCQAALEASVSVPSVSPERLERKREYSRAYHKRKREERAANCVVCHSREKLEDSDVCIVCRIDGAQADLTEFDK